MGYSINKTTPDSVRKHARFSQRESSLGSRSGSPRKYVLKNVRKRKKLGSPEPS